MEIFNCIGSDFKGRKCSAIFCIVIHLLSNLSDGAELKPLNAIVEANEGEPLTLLCPTEEDRRIDTCEFQIPSYATKIRVYDGVKNANYEFIGDFSTGLCGIKILAADVKHRGEAHCSVSYPDNVDIAQAKFQVKVLQPPKNLTLTPNNPRFTYTDGDEMRIRCSVLSGDPTPLVTIQFDEFKTTGQRTVEIRKKVNSSDDRRKVLCFVEHPDIQGRLEVEDCITVKHAPLMIKPAFCTKGYLLENQGKTVSVNALVKSQPRPTSFKWKVDGKPADDENYRFFEEPSTLFDSYFYGLEFAEVSPQDLEANFTLVVINEVQTSIFNFTCGEVLEVNEQGTPAKKMPWLANV